MTYTFLLTSTSKGYVNYRRLTEEVESASIVPTLDYLDSDDTSVTLRFISALSQAERDILDTLTAAHDGTADSEIIPPTEVNVLTQPLSAPFADKIIWGGLSLFKRKHGVTGSMIATGQSGTTLFTVPYQACKINEVEILNSRENDSINLQVGIPTSVDENGNILTYAVLNQFGFDVNLPAGFYREHSNYDADLVAGLIIILTYKNNGQAVITPRYNLTLHEVT